MTPDHGKCRDCRHYDSATLTSGSCHIRAPKVQVVLIPQENMARQMQMVPQILSAWPPVQPDQWCGEFSLGKLLS
jgi:hypothetical protein